MINVVAALKDQSHHLHAMILPMIHSSCDINNKMHVYLMVDGLELWTTVMHHASTLTPDLLAIFPLLFSEFKIHSLAHTVATSLSLMFSNLQNLF